MNIKVIGSGCENCDKTNAVVKECLEELGMDTEIERVTDLVEIVKLGVMTAPSVMIDGKLVVAGQVPSKNGIMKEKMESIIRFMQLIWRVCEKRKRRLIRIWMICLLQMHQSRN